MSLRRSIPEFAPETFQAWFHRRAKMPVAPNKRVVLFPDTFNNHFFPHTACAAIEVLEDAGYQVLVPSGHVCCGRPLYDYGFLDMAKSYLLKIMDVLMPYIAQGAQIVVLEPSCWSVLRDEINEMFPESDAAHKIMENTFLLSDFLTEHTDYRPPALHMGAIMHAHCHHKALISGAEHERTLLEKMGLSVRILSDGCCGMAGSFGFEEDKYEVSAKIGEHALIPAVRPAGLGELVIADGFSCREQISQMTNRHALHMAEVLQVAIRYGAGGPGGILPEREMVRERSSLAQIQD